MSDSTFGLSRLTCTLSNTMSMTCVTPFARWQLDDGESVVTATFALAPPTLNATTIAAIAAAAPIPPPSQRVLLMSPPPDRCDTGLGERRAALIRRGRVWRTCYAAVTGYSRRA